MPAALEYVEDGDWHGVRRNTDTTAKLLNPVVPQARVFNSAAISIVTSGTGQILTFDSYDYDNGALHSTGANTSRLTAPITGLYSIGAAVSFASNATGYRQVQLLVNGATFIADETRPAVNGTATSVVIGDVQWRMVAGDYVECRVVQTSTGALNVSRTSRLSPEFWMHRVSGYVNQGV